MSETSTVFIMDNCHEYRKAKLIDGMKIVYNKKYQTYSEYAGDEYCDFENGDEIITGSVVE